MADYFIQTVVEQVIPDADVTPLERLVLTHVFDYEKEGDGLYLFAEDFPRDLLSIPATTLKAAHAASDGFGGMATFITGNAVKDSSTHHVTEDCIADFKRKKPTPPAPT